MLENLSQELLFRLIYMLTGLCVLLLLIALSNPYRLRQGSIGADGALCFGRTAARVDHLDACLVRAATVDRFSVEVDDVGWGSRPVVLVASYVLYWLVDWRLGLLGVVAGGLCWGITRTSVLKGAFPKRC